MSPRPGDAEGGPDAVEVRAPGKVNLGLRVAARRGDGYHEIDTLFVTVDVADRLRLTRTVSGVDGTVVASDAATGASAVPAIADDNLAGRAAAAWLEAAGAPGGVRIELDKRLPVAAGLGGGSSDAGAVLRAMALLWPAELDVGALAKRLGSDVPFFAAGLAAARGRGRGERLATVELRPRWLVLVNPGVPVPVAEAYGELRAFGPPVAWDAVTAAWNEGDAPVWRNDLQAGVLGRYAAVRAALGALRDAGLAAPLLSGSGATCFALAEDEEQARASAAALAQRGEGWWVRAVRAPAEAAEPRAVLAAGAAPRREGSR